MDQKISIKIAERVFYLTASSPEQEEVIRLAADAINKRLENYTRRNPGKSTSELMSMVALNECACRIFLQRDLDARNSEVKQLEQDLDSYLARTEK
jgi:cell division protein ZapA (FtsZ GTPase activity inhibitor)